MSQDSLQIKSNKIWRGNASGIRTAEATVNELPVNLATGSYWYERLHTIIAREINTYFHMLSNYGVLLSICMLLWMTVLIGQIRLDACIISRSLAALAAIQQISMFMSTLITLYNAFVHCCVVWHFHSKTLSNNYAMRLILKKRPRTIAACIDSLFFT